MHSTRSTQPSADGKSAVWSELNVFGILPDVSLRGEPLRELAGTHSFEDVAALLLYGSLPSVDLSADVQCRLAEVPPLDPAIDERIRSLPWHLSLCEALKSGLMLLSQFEERSADSGPETTIDLCLSTLVQSIRLIALRYCVSQSVPLPREGVVDEIAGLFLELSRGEEPDDLDRKVLDTFLVLHAIEPGSPSDVAVRAVAAGGGEFHEALLAGISASDLERKTCELAEVVEFLDRIESEEELVSVCGEISAGRLETPELCDQLSKCELLRNELLNELCRELSIEREQEGFERIARELERAVAPRQLRPVWAGARLFHYLGLEHELVSPLLALARIPCWTACYLEQQKLSAE